MLGRSRFSSSTNSCVLLGFFVAMLVASAMLGLISLPSPSSAFLLPSHPTPIRSALIPRRIRARGDWGRSCFVVLEQATTSSSSASLPEVSSMRAGDIRKELESYGISTKSFLEKKELVEALEKAREEGRTPVEVEVEEEPQSTDEKVESETSASKTSNSNATSTGDDSKSGEDNSKSRDERIASEVEKCKLMKVSELRSELKGLGISTRSFFEKSEFVKALAEARVDGVKKRAGRSREQQEEEDYDPEYKDVVMKKFEAGKDPRMRLTGDVIDITI